MQFAPRKNPGSKLGAYIGLGIFLIIGLVFLSGKMNGTDKRKHVTAPGSMPYEQKIGFGLTLVAGLALAWTVVSARAVKRYYEIKESGLEIGMGPLAGPATLAFADMAAAAVVGHETVEQKMLEIYRSSVSRNNDSNANMAGMAGFHEVIKYASVPVGPAAATRRTENVRIEAAGDFVELSMKDGSFYFLSPADAAGLASAISERLQK